ncbi:GerAB/ArcD/ProY family transporter [Peribacillus simplex]|uniref:GerAB/ArcD/ProY family transporter n=2 Tax=Peribacillus simplex TaxID=1478 RepID=A0A8B5XVB9_9BACI|nr:GerAB/ArcD/ProY family transporter [Peribacillus simplex]
MPPHIKSEGMCHMIKSISTFQATIVLILSIGLMNHVIVLPSLLGASGRDSWISTLVTGMLFLLWLPMVYWIIHKTKQQHIIGWLHTHSHPIAAWSIKILLFLYLLLNLFVTLFSTFSWVNSTYMIQTPEYILFIPFIILCFIAAEAGIKTIAIAGGLVLPLVVALGFMIMTANIQYKDYSLLFPIFENGITPVWDGVVILGGGFTEIFLLVLFQQFVKTEIKFRSLLFLGLFLLFISMGPIIGSITEFGPVQAAKISNPAYAQWRLLTMGKYLNRLDFLSIYQWLSGAFIRVSLSIFLMGELFQIKSKKIKNIVLLAISVSLIIALCIPIDMPAYRDFTERYYFKLSVISILVITFFISIVIFLKERVKKNGASIEQGK